MNQEQMNQEQMNLEQMRAEIDSLDEQITALVVTRMKVCAEVAAYKRANQLPVYQPEREAAVIEKVKKQVAPAYQPAISAVYHCMMNESKELQKKIIASESKKPLDK